MIAMTIDQIRQPILNEYNLFLEEYQRRTQSNVVLLKQVVDYLNQIPGKQLRPLLVLLSAKACQHLSPLHIKLATAIEMLHNASLMHDDVVDESNSRRQHDSVRHRWGNQVAVLCGDYYLAQAMDALHQIQDDAATDIVNSTVVTLCEGELKQLAHAGHELDEATYLDIIGSKTASLLSACCELGACSLVADTPSPYRQAMRDFGYHYGLAFQIRDDMADLQEAHDIKMPSSINPNEPVTHHAQLAANALKPIPDSPAKQSLLCLLQKIQCN